MKKNLLFIATFFPRRFLCFVRWAVGNFRNWFRALFPKKTTKFSGTVARTTDREYGFLTPEGNGKDIFFHASEVIGGEFNDLLEMGEVEFDIVEREKGPVAVNVRPKQRNDDISEDNEEGPLSEIDLELNNKVTVAVKTLSRSLVLAIAENPELLRDIEWRDMERLVAEVFTGLGFEVELTSSSKDGGMDCIVSTDISNTRKSYAIEIKHWRSGKKVGSSSVEKFIHIIARENMLGGLFLASNGFSKSVCEFMMEFDSQVISFGDDQKIVHLCRKYSRSQDGIWKQTNSLEDIIFEDSLLVSEG